MTKGFSKESIHKILMVLIIKVASPSLPPPLLLPPLPLPISFPLPFQHLPLLYPFSSPCPLPHLFPLPSLYFASEISHILTFLPQSVSQKKKLFLFMGPLPGLNVKDAEPLIQRLISVQRS